MGWMTAVQFLAGAMTGSFFTNMSRPVLGLTPPPIQSLPGVISPWIKQQLGHEADHSPPSSAKNNV